MILLTGHTHHIADIAEICLPSKRAYAERWGLELRVLRDDDFPQSRGHPSFQKIRHIISEIECGHDVLWLDADSLITNVEFDPSSFMPRHDAFVSASKDYGGFERHHEKQWSAGNCYWHRWAITWLVAAHYRTEYANSGLWDQDALQATQPAGAVDIRPPRVLNAVHPSFNLEASWKPGDFLIHFTGMHNTKRAQSAREFIAKYQH